ncbi:MAG: PorT family protein [Saprospiraceae bacterium]|nr:PorT family protein [Saprospiraceae bacterium]
MINIIKFSICLGLFLPAMMLKGQTFSAAVIAGANAAQVNGDLLAGYNKLGIHGGLRVSVEVANKIDGALELLFSQRGSRSSIGSGDPRKMHLNYVEVPLLIGYRDWPNEDYHRMLFEGGLSYGRLISNTVSLAGIEDSVDEFNPNDVSYLLGATYFGSSRVGYSFRYTNSLNFLLNDRERPEFGRLRSYFLSFRILFYL